MAILFVRPNSPGSPPLAELVPPPSLDGDGDPLGHSELNVGGLLDVEDAHHGVAGMIGWLPASSSANRTVFLVSRPRVPSGLRRSFVTQAEGLRTVARTMRYSEQR